MPGIHPYFIKNFKKFSRVNIVKVMFKEIILQNSKGTYNPLKLQKDIKICKRVARHFTTRYFTPQILKTLHLSRHFTPQKQ
jgi:hypothetical protein